MKLFVVLLLVCASVLYARGQEFTKEKVDEVAKNCKESVGATDSDVADIFNHEPLTSGPAKCLHACVLKKFGLMTDDGKMDKDAALAVLEALSEGDEQKEKVATEIVESCAGIDVPSDHCEASELYVKCVHQHAQERASTSMSRLKALLATWRNENGNDNSKNELSPTFKTPLQFSLRIFKI